MATYVKSKVLFGLNFLQFSSSDRCMAQVEKLGLADDVKALFLRNNAPGACSRSPDLSSGDGCSATGGRPILVRWSCSECCNLHERRQRVGVPPCFAQTRRDYRAHPFISVGFLNDGKRWCLMW
jgi:hypothetical protein